MTDDPAGKWPDFLILGGMKCGTKSLWSWLKQHPEITTPFFKEASFFDGTNWHRARPAVRPPARWQVRRRRST